MSEPVFNNCNVCGRELMRADEFGTGMCAICANEETTFDEINTPDEIKPFTKEMYAKETVGVREGIPTLDRPLRLFLEKRAARLRKIQKRWQECGETECAAIYQGAAFELELLLKT